ncbi:MAG: isopropylmalate isomerase [Rhodobacteraceae bacterium]|nr:isopropylmalate isomerase [Paracoccaceae bacterium]
MYLVGMTPFLALSLNLDDRARLRERFFGAERAVLARS